MEPIISANGLCKRFGEFDAVLDLDLAIFPGECFGFLGPNGAGKTSTIRMMCCLSPISRGSLSVNYMMVHDSPRTIKAALGVVSQDDELDSNLSVLQNLLVYGRYFNMPGNVAYARAMEVLELFQLRDKAQSTIRDLSGGMRRRLMIARALLPEPRILILDEPTTGLDPQARHLVWQKVRLLKSQGITIVLSTHYMEEASYLCDRVAIMDAGRIVAQGAPLDLISEYVGSKVLEVTVGLNDGQKWELMCVLKDLGCDSEDAGDRVLIYGPETLALEESLIGKEVSVRATHLEDVFLRLTGRTMLEESG